MSCSPGDWVCHSGASAPGLCSEEEGMELFDNLGLGFATATTLWNLIFCLIGVLLGTLIGVLPGIGATATIAMLLPITFKIGDPVASLIMLAGIYYGAQYGGSTTAILINMPGESSSAVTAIAGYQMAGPRRGGTGGRRARLVLRRYRVDLPRRAVRTAADADRAAVRRGRVFFPHGRRPGLVHRVGARIDRQGAGDGRARLAVRAGRQR